MSKQSVSFVTGEKTAKFCVGPASSRPGPTLFIEVITAVSPVVKLWPSNETINVEIVKTEKKIKKYAEVVLTTDSSTVRPSIDMVSIFLGQIIFLISRFAFLKRIINLDIFIPPPVLPAQAPQNIRSIIMALENVGQRSKSAVANPVVDMIDATVKNE